MLFARKHISLIPVSDMAARYHVHLAASGRVSSNAASLCEECRAERHLTVRSRLMSETWRWPRRQKCQCMTQKPKGRSVPFLWEDRKALEVRPDAGLDAVA
jgi:hypothetical protein